MKRLPFIALNFAGLVAFALPFLRSASARAITSARTDDAPWLAAALVPMLIMLAILEAGRSRSDARSIALMGVLVGAAALMRLPISFAGANLIFFLPIIAGAVFGPSFGFVVGALAMAGSALITGGIGPWLPFQMWACGWVAMGAGLLRPLIHRPRAALLLAPYGWCAAFIYGGLMDLYFWPVTAQGSAAIGYRPGLGVTETLSHFRAFYLSTSLAWDAVGAFANLVVFLLLARPLVELLQRYKRRFSFAERSDESEFGTPGRDDLDRRVVGEQVDLQNQTS